MDNDIKGKLQEESKNNMPDLWGKIEGKLEDKKKRSSKKNLAIAASLAVVFTVGIMGEVYLQRDEMIVENSIYNEVANENDLYDKLYNKSELNIEEVEVLEELDLERILEDKIVVSLNSNTSYSVDPNSIDYDAISDNIVYGKVTSVNSYVKFAGSIYSDMTVEVIEDYKGEFKQGDTFIMGDAGGEMTYEDYIAQMDPMRVEKFGYDKIEDKSKMFIDLSDGIPMYREGEYVLVYVKALDNDEYYKERPELRANETYDYGVYKRLYVDPNTRDVFKYEYKMDNTLKKIKAGTLNDIENIDLSINLH